MPNDPTATALQKDIGEMLLQSDRWSMIVDKAVNLGYPITGIAKTLLEEDKEIADYYARTGSTNPQKTLMNLILYHLREKVPVADRVGTKFVRAFFERETGNMNILEEMKQMIDIQKERVAFSVGFERKFNIPSIHAGKELATLTKMYGTLGQLLVAAGLVSQLQDEARQPESTKSATSQERKDRVERFMEMYIEKNPGVTKAQLLEKMTGISDITRHAPKPTLTHAVGEAL